MPFNGFSQEMRIQLDNYTRYSTSSLSSSHQIHQPFLTQQFIRSNNCNSNNSNVPPQWERYTNFDEKKVWKAGNRERQISTTTTANDYYTFKRQLRSNRRQRNRNSIDTEIRTSNEISKKLDEFDDEDYPEDAMFGKPINAADYDDDSKSEHSYSLKYTNDKIRVLEFLRSLKGIDEIKRTRFLFVSAQTYGNFDGICMPAEIAICEFNLRYGIIDQFTSIVGPWHIDNEIQRRRAEFHARETHKIHLEGPIGRTNRIATQHTCLREILGRYDPSIAEQQSFSVGLYRGGVREFDTDTPNFNASSKQVNISGEMKGIHVIFGGDSNGKRWLICLKHEYENIRSSLQYLKESQGNRYDGFSTIDDQYVFADALVDGIAEHLKGVPNAEYKLWMDIFGIKQPFEFITPWERRANVFCRLHTASRNCCCASATAARSCFAIFFALHQLLQLPFGD